MVFISFFFFFQWSLLRFWSGQKALPYVRILPPKLQNNIYNLLFFLADTHIPLLTDDQTHLSMDKETSENVTIVVKSPYQIFSDQTICCSTDWTVERLKEEITQLCPSHPVSEGNILLSVQIKLN